MVGDDPLYSQRRKNLFIDIETIPNRNSQVQDYLTSHIAPPSNYKDAGKIAEYVAAHSDKTIAQTALSGMWGEIIAIGWAVDEEAPKCVMRACDQSEDAFLTIAGREVNEHLGLATRWVGFNLGFDTRFLWQRCMVNRVVWPGYIPRDQNPWSDTIFDVQHHWAGRDIKGVSLNNLAIALGIKPVSDKLLDPRDLPKLWESEQYDQISDYCREDVKLTQDIFGILIGYDKGE